MTECMYVCMYVYRERENVRACVYDHRPLLRRHRSSCRSPQSHPRHRHRRPPLSLMTTLRTSRCRRPSLFFPHTHIYIYIHSFIVSALPTPSGSSPKSTPNTGAPSCLAAGAPTTSASRLASVTTHASIKPSAPSSRTRAMRGCTIPRPRSAGSRTREIRRCRRCGRAGR